ncbi:MAG: hypothetical protein ABI142_02850, partial [Bryocella sp.]
QKRPPSGGRFCLNNSLENLEVHIDIHVHGHRLTVLHRRFELVLTHRVDTMIAQIAVATAQQAAAADQSSASLGAIHALSGENLSEMAVTAQGIEALREAAVSMEVQAGLSIVTHQPASRTAIFPTRKDWAAA